MAGKTTETQTARRTKYGLNVALTMIIFTVHFWKKFGRGTMFFLFSLIIAFTSTSIIGMMLVALLEYKKILLAVFMMTLIPFMAVIMYFIMKRIQEPFLKLSECARKLMEGDFE